MKRALLLATLLAPLPALAQHAPYAGLERREIRALSAAQVEDLLQGRGMTLALAAELNGWPGPSHVLEHAEALHLSADQRRATETLMAAHRARAMTLGRQIVEAERELDRAFRDRSVTPATLAAQTDRIGALQAALRAEHLRTHLEQTALLHPPQVARYAALRGYAGGTPAPEGHRHRH
ncbi:periplasmic heavy metal sensor [Roseococcus thiosulfatophilus]|uniref:periplasmic heavy metal sensor n=1 Tax=Roseococcus thiosulfatophilus TaxID=35813 RepID=UPI001A8F30F9|nr:periplasmic heavy metal sensor [Roseococcus thiosulfatophilus]